MKGGDGGWTGTMLDLWARRGQAWKTRYKHILTDGGSSGRGRGRREGKASNPERRAWKSGDLGGRGKGRGKKRRKGGEDGASLPLTHS